MKTTRDSLPYPLRLCVEMMHFAIFAPKTQDKTASQLPTAKARWLVASAPSFGRATATFGWLTKTALLKELVAAIVLLVRLGS